MPNELVTLAEAKRRLRITSSAEDADVRALIAEAQAIVLGFINQRRSDDGSPTWAETIEAWDDDTVPADIKAAILRQTAELDRLRGDDPASAEPSREPGQLSNNVRSLLIRYRDPAVS
jgi:hypothetical protein